MAGSRDKGSEPTPVGSPLLEPVPFAALPHWPEDDHGAALEAFLASLSRFRDREALAGTATDWRGDPRGFFEANFVLHRVVQAGGGLVTGYYEPLLAGSLTRSAAFPVPIHRRPADLLELVPDALRGADPTAATHMRKGPSGLEPYASREAIDRGALDGQGLELAWLADPVDRFILQVQGSGTLALAEGGTLGLSYDGKNGHPYTSVGRYLIEQGHVTADAMSLAAMAAWLRADPERGRHAMWQNRSYVFFKPRDGHARGPVGALDIPLQPLRSLAVDAGLHALGTPIYVDAPELRHGQPDGRPFQRLMIAHDVGSAITGPERGDIYFGSGEAAGALAGITKHAVRFYVLCPRAVARPGGER